MPPPACRRHREPRDQHRRGRRFSQGYGASWTATAPPGVSIVGAYTPVNDVYVDCNLSSEGFTAEYQWASGTQSINYVNGCGAVATGVGYADGINTSFAPSSWFGWAAGCYLKSSCQRVDRRPPCSGCYGVRLTAEEDSGPSVDRRAVEQHLVPERVG